MRCVGGVRYGDMQAMTAEGQARLEPPGNPGYVSTDYCTLAVGYMESGVVGICVCAAGSELRGVTGDGRIHGGGGTRTTRGPLLLCRMGASLYLGCCSAPIGDALAFCLLLCRCVAVPCPFTPAEQTDQRPSPLLMLLLAVATAPKAWLAGITGPLGPLSCCRPPQAALGPTGSSEARTTCPREMPGNFS